MRQGGAGINASATIADMTAHTRCLGSATVVVLILTACGDGANGPEAGSAPPERSARACVDSTALSDRLHFAGAEEAGTLLGRPDDWSTQLSAFERSARVKTLEPVTEEQLLDHLSGQGVDWTVAERTHWGELVDRLRAALVGLDLELPALEFVQSTGRDEFGAAYSRSGAVVLPESRVAISGNERADFFLLAHEVAHAISWSDASLRDELFGLLGFERFDGFDPPPELETRRLSNPDGHTYQHALEVETPDGSAYVVPFVRSSVPLEEVIALPAAGPEFFEVLDVLLLPVDIETGDLARGPDGALLTYDLADTNWPARMSRNTSYVIHPAEVMADNVASVMEWRSTGVMPADNASGTAVGDPDLLRAIEEVLVGMCADPPG